MLLINICCYPSPSLNYCNNFHIGFPAFLPLLTKSLFSIKSVLLLKCVRFFPPSAYTCNSFPFHSIKAKNPQNEAINLQDLALTTLPLSLHFLPHLPTHSTPAKLTCLLFIAGIRSALPSLFSSWLFSLHEILSSQRST